MALIFFINVVAFVAIAWRRSSLFVYLCVVCLCEGDVCGRSVCYGQGKVGGGVANRCRRARSSRRGVRAVLVVRPVMYCMVL